MRNLVLTAVCAAIVTITAAPVQAAREPVEIRISLKNLNLARTQTVTRAEMRIDRAVRKACTLEAGFDPTLDFDCFNEARDAALAQLGEKRAASAIPAGTRS